jgi:ornithine cyclodeaminase
MPAYSARDGWGLKVVNIYPDNPKRGLDAHQGVVLLFDGESGETKAIMNASAITAIRTAAVSGVATRLLAREDASVLAVLGAGVQARSHLQAMSCAMRTERVYLWARDFERAQSVAREFDGVTPVESCEEAVREADVVCTTTSAREPILRREWLKAGAHVNAVGSSVRSARELDTQTMVDASVFVDRFESTQNESGDYLIPLQEGARVEIAAELGEVIAGAHPGRTRDDELTVFKSLGIAVEDLAAARYLYDRAQQTGTGTWLAF